MKPTDVFLVLRDTMLTSKFLVSIYILIKIFSTGFFVRSTITYHLSEQSIPNPKRDWVSFTGLDRSFEIVSTGFPVFYCACSRDALSRYDVRLRSFREDRASHSRPYVSSFFYPSKWIWQCSAVIRVSFDVSHLRTRYVTMRIDQTERLVIWIRSELCNLTRPNRSMCSLYLT